MTVFDHTQPRRTLQQIKSACGPLVLHTSAKVYVEQLESAYLDACQKLEKAISRPKKPEGRKAT